MLHGTKSSRFRNGRGPSTSQSGNAILAKARKEREQRENQKLQVAACTIIQSKIRLALCRRKTYAEFLNGNLVPGLYTSLCKNKSIPVFPIRRSDLWFVKLEIQSKFAVLKKMTEDSTMSPEFFFLLVGSALKSYVSLMSQECFIDLINILLDGVENNADEFYRVLDSSFLQDESSTDLQEDSDLYLNNPGLIYFRAYDASLGDLLNYVGNSTSGKLLIKRLLKTLITPAYVLYTLFVSTKLTQYIYEEDAYEIMTPTEEQLSQIKEFPVSKLTLYRSVDMGIFQPFVLCFKNYTPVYSFLVDHIIETSTLRQLHLHAIQCNFVKFPNCPAEYSFKAHYKQLGIFFLSVVKLKHNDPVYMWILYGLYHMYDYHIGPFPSQYLANPVFEITNCNKVFSTLNKVVEWSTSTKSYFEMTYCYFYLKTCYEGHIALEEILNGPSQILEVEPNEINLKALAYIYARIPYDNELALKIKLTFEFDSELNDVFMSFEDTSVEQASAHWGRNLHDYRAELIKVFGVQQLGPGLQIDRENMNTSIIKAMMAINHNQFNVRYKGEEGRGDGLKKQFLTDSMKLFFMKSKMFDIDYEKAKLWPSKKFFETPVGELFEDDSVQHLHHKSLIELAGKCLGLMMLENYLCPFVFSKAFLMKFTARLLLKHEQVKELDFEKSQIDFLNFADLEVEDQSLHEQLLTLTKLSSEELEAMDLFMEYKDCNFGVSHGMPVNKNNLHLYIDNIVNYELNDSKTETFVEHFTAGFVKMIPPHVTSQLLALSFNRCKFLSTVISGEGRQAFPVEEFLESLTYQGYHRWDQRIRTLGEILKYEMDDRDRWAFFEFVTGMAMIPITGIKNMEPKVCIAKMPNYTNDMIAYPTASTCVNMLVLPDYENRDEMIERLAYVVSSDHEFHRE